MADSRTQQGKPHPAGGAVDQDTFSQPVKGSRLLRALFKVAVVGGPAIAGYDFGGVIGVLLSMPVSGVCFWALSLQARLAAENHAKLIAEECAQMEALVGWKGYDPGTFPRSNGPNL